MKHLLLTSTRLRGPVCNIDVNKQSFVYVHVLAPVHMMSVMMRGHFLPDTTNKPEHNIYMFTRGDPFCI